MWFFAVFGGRPGFGCRLGPHVSNRVMLTVC
jgi:hypothetical protein